MPDINRTIKIIASLREKTVEAGCEPGEVALAQQKIGELIQQYEEITVGTNGAPLGAASTPNMWADMGSPFSDVIRRAQQETQARAAGFDYTAQAPFQGGASWTQAPETEEVYVGVAQLWKIEDDKAFLEFNAAEYPELDKKKIAIPLSVIINSHHWGQLGAAGRVVEVTLTKTWWKRYVAQTRRQKRDAAAEKHYGGGFPKKEECIEVGIVTPTTRLASVKTEWTFRVDIQKRINGLAHMDIKFINVPEESIYQGNRVKLGVQQDLLVSRLWGLAWRDKENARNAGV